MGILRNKWVLIALLVVVLWFAYSRYIATRK